MLVFSFLCFRTIYNCFVKYEYKQKYSFELFGVYRDTYNIQVIFMDVLLSKCVLCARRMCASCNQFDISNIFLHVARCHCSL